ncbi:MAG: AAA family ATPase [Cyanobacteria bacterium P01_C01_bin.89]
MINADSSPNPFPQLDGYTVTELLYLGARAGVYRATCNKDGRSVAIKVLRDASPRVSDRVQFRNQYAIASNLDIPGIVKPLDLKVDQGFALVMEDWAGIPLGQYLQQRRQLDIGEGLAIARQLTNILHDLHQERVIHKDIKPDNILIDRSSSQVTLIDFSIASLLPKEVQQLQSPNVLEGTLGYLAPEQTGRMNRGIDYRTDFYGLGVTLYQLWSGRLPFEADDPLAAIHSHIAKTPEPLDRLNSTIPAVVAAIVGKLMAKNAEDRYQSARGIEFDLATCAAQWRETGEILTFDLGTRDLSDRFSIPEKLYGREAEVDALLDAFGRVTQGQSEIMLVAGFSGIGKTAVVNEVHKPIARQRGYFIKGKFGQFNRDIPLSAFVGAFRELIATLLSEPDAQLAEWRSAILGAVEQSGRVIVEVIPELERIIGPQPPVPELMGAAAQNRFNRLFLKFVRVFTRADCPLVVFLDDLQWADSASLELMKLLMEQGQYLLLLGAYRDNEVSPSHPMMQVMGELEWAGETVWTIALEPLDLDHTVQLVADTLHCSTELARPLGALVRRKTDGNPFFATQFLKALYEDGQITFNGDRQHWECDITAIQQLALTDDVVELMASQLRKLPAATQELLQLAACVGSQFDLATLGIVGERSPLKTADLLWPALEDGLILPIDQIYKFFQTGEGAIEAGEVGDMGDRANPTYRFLHDRVQQAAYIQGEDDDQRLLHLRIGRLLQRELTADERQERLFDIVGHLNLGRTAIAEAAERNALAAQNLDAARKAKQSTAYDAAQRFAEIGIELLGGDRWETQYELSLALQTILTEAHCLGGNFEATDACGAVGLAHAKTAIHKVPIILTQMSALATRRIPGAVALATNALAELGVDFPMEPDAPGNREVLATLETQLQSRPIESLVDLPKLNNPRILAAMQLLATLTGPVMVTNPPLYPLVSARIVSLSLAFGNSPVSSFGYAFYGLCLTCFQGEITRGYRFGKVALELFESLEAVSEPTQVMLAIAQFLKLRKEPIAETQLLLKRGYHFGMEVGEFLYAGYSINHYWFNRLFMGYCLTNWNDELKQYRVVLEQVKEQSPAAYCGLSQQLWHNLTTPTAAPDLLVGRFFDETEKLPYYAQNHERVGIGLTYTNKLQLAYLFNRDDAGLEHIEKTESYLDTVVGYLSQFVFHAYAGLTYLRVAGKQLAVDQALELATPHQETVAQWAQHAPMNYQHLWELMEAERLRVLGRSYEAADYYDRAIAGAAEQGFVNNVAIANEQAAKFYLAWDRPTLAASYMQAAYDNYERWGAKAKAIALQQTYPQWFDKSQSPSRTGGTDGSNNDQLFDVPTVMQATQAISQEIEPDKLLSRLVQLALANAGATRVDLAIKRKAHWTLVARAEIATADTLKISSDETGSDLVVELCDRPLEMADSVPHSVINTVIRTEQVAVFDNLSQVPEFAADLYITLNQPKSALCVPLNRQGKTLGVLYLENNLTTGAFVGDRVDVLQTIAGQAAISLENARLYQEVASYSQTLEAEVANKTQALRQKTQDLEQTLVDLKHAQAQLIQREKMSALGQLVGGIAHEINNPVTFIRGNIHHAKGYVEDLLQLVSLYAHHYPEPVSEIEDALEDIDLPFLQDDVQKIWQSMATGSQRIAQIVTDLRNFSRLDEADMKAVDLHTGLDSTLLVLRDRCKGSDKQPAIAILKNYGDLPKVKCYARELNQVFFSLLDNAINAINELGAAASQSTPQIHIETTVQGDRHVTIKISDTGCGIPETERSQIFEPFFTTKPVGSGTGLGLSVSYAIVQRHGGELSCKPFPGGGTTFTVAIPLST